MEPTAAEVARKTLYALELNNRLLAALVRIQAATDGAALAKAEADARRLFGEGGTVVPIRRDG